IEKIALEMHPGFCVYNTETLLRLREAAGHAIGANFDPSHLYWQGMEPAESIHRLSGAIYHFHAKDVRLQAYNTAVNGVLDTREESISGPGHRPWLFRTVGYGHGAAEWREMLSALRLAGYGGAISIEHEDVLMSAEEGLEKAIDFLKPMVFRNEAGDIFWK
ncbi:MAG: TIM barrel protein, partial [Clostridiales Family XIII bacterium]|nr:TIM barrel protein [Clostridiales Family XIII bacterium]